jgi:beta-phosphoglucomutase-like phosphatase (HAD superfamily)
MIVFVVNALQRQYTGIYHFYNPQDKTTKYNMACIIGKFLDKPVTHIEPINMPISVAGRPFDTQLVDPQYNRDLFPFTPLEKGIEACFQQFKHPLLKQHVKPSESIFYLFDLDGTLLDTEKLHYECYKQAFEYLQIPFCSWLEYQSILAFDEYCKETCGTQYEPMKQKKNQLFYSTQEISFLPGAKLFLQWLLDSNQNFVIVTNTSYKTIEFYKQKQPLLQRVLQWVARDDVQEAKPNPESYKLAKEKYYKNETYTIGFENTMTGYFSIQSICPIVYLICEPHTICYSKLYDRDIYFIRNFEWTAE